MWSWFQAAETTSQAAVPTEPEAAQSLLGLMGRIGIGENEASVAILNKTHWGLGVFPETSFPLQPATSSKGVLCRFGDRPRWVPP